MQLAPASTAARCAAPGFRFRLQVEETHLQFRRPARTSRGELCRKERYEIVLTAEDGRCGRGEATPMPRLSPEGGADYADRLRAACRQVETCGGLAPEMLADAPSMRFGIECALLSALAGGGDAPLWDSPFTHGEAGIAIHHLIWMDSTPRMLACMAEGIARGFSCLKLKVGALPWEDELALLAEAHARFPQAEIRVDANGAFSPKEAVRKLAELAACGVSLIEQPLRAGQWANLSELIAQSPLPIALDEELIAARTPADRERLLDTLRPHALVLKPSLHGGLAGLEHWVQLAQQYGIRWWLNSALEGPLGLAALAEWCGAFAPDTLHGLGTGLLYRDAAPCRVQLRGNRLEHCGSKHFS